ncbi:1914_t:CDS:2 [Ambispora gerdemannii]|uniref:1914_t:CDS:1 n=1 Tax=Ambispora gerdemannii TaxID=144530 RepID=A0A9N9G403_9GLOM|nr:1914_t:CDS:2 [Ambispora gerdemannii]
MTLNFELTLKDQIKAEFIKEKEDAINMIQKRKRDHYQKHGSKFAREEYIFAHFLMTAIYDFRVKFLNIYDKSHDDIDKTTKAAIKTRKIFQDETKLELLNNWNIIYNTMKNPIQSTEECKGLEKKELKKEFIEKYYRQLLYSEEFCKLLEVLEDDSEQLKASNPRVAAELCEFFIDIFDAYSVLHSLSLWYRVPEDNPENKSNRSYNCNLVELFGLEPVIMSYEKTWKTDWVKFNEVLSRYLLKEEEEVNNIFRVLKALENLKNGEEMDNASDISEFLEKLNRRAEKERGTQKENVELNFRDVFIEKIQKFDNYRVTAPDNLGHFSSSLPPYVFQTASINTYKSFFAS